MAQVQVDKHNLRPVALGRWLVGYIRRGARCWVFVSNVVGPDRSPLAAVDLAARGLKSAGVL